MIRFNKAILIIHGFAGGVYDEEYLFKHLQLERRFDVYNFTLPGHDGNINNKYNKESWLNSTRSEVEFLINNGYKKIYVIGHSMGGVLASVIASEYKEIKKLVLVAPAFRIFGYEDGDLTPTEALKQLPKTFDYYGKRTLANRMLRMPLNSFTEFIKLIDEYQNVLEKVYIPTLIIRGNNDSVVPETSVEHALSSLSAKKKKLVHYRSITHDVFKNPLCKKVTKDIIKFLHKTYYLQLIKDSE